MKVSLNWLKEYIDIFIPVPELAHKLTMSGTEAGSTQTTGGNWENVFVGEVLEVKPHPNADRLRLATVSLGAETVTVVCGAPNVAAGQNIPFARLGAKLKDGHTGQPVTLKPAKIRGVVSEGMVCSERELGISDNYEGILVLPGDAPVGKPLSEYLGDTILDLKVTPNRPDCLSVIGIAREVAALTQKSICLPKAGYAEHDPPIHQSVAVEISAPDLCPRYCASLIAGVKIGPSPQWMQQRLTACGMRPINNVVDITNYVMLEYGQPLHAFDFQHIRGGKIIVRPAAEGELLATIDGAKRTLDKDMLVIADGERPVALAGVMGGTDSEVSEGTTSVLLESANFNHISIRRTSAKLRMRSEASARFDKKLSPDLPIEALRRATSLIVEIAGGKAARDVVDVYPGKKERRPVWVQTERIGQLLGMEIPSQRILEVLGWLGFTTRIEGSNLVVTPPHWRTDVSLPEDIVEEVARIIGYDEFPTTTIRGEIPSQQPAPMLVLKDRIRHLMTSCGMQEVINYSLVGIPLLEKSGLSDKPALRLANPMTADQEYLRTSLRGGLLASYASNSRHEESGMRFFEIGKAYIPREKDLPEERETLCGVLGGPRTDRSWFTSGEAIDFFDAKGILEAMFSRLHVAAVFEPAEEPNFLPGRTARVMVGGKATGFVGEVHPGTTSRFDISGPVYLFEIDLDALLPFASAMPRYQPVPRFPGTARDIAIIVDAGVPANKIEGIVRGFPLVTGFTVFDVYSGKQVPEGKKSLAFSVTYQSPERTLKDEEVDRTHQQIIDRLQRETGATLRS